MNPGIDALSFYSPHYYLDLHDLAAARDVPVAKYIHGIGQEKMAVPPPDEDVVTMAANAAADLLEQRDRRRVGAVLFATESGVDQSKAAAVYVHQLLGLPADCQAIELKQACCSSSVAVRLATLLAAANPARDVLVLAADVARYGLGTAGECTQGAGAVAILVTAAPRLLEIEPVAGQYTEDCMDFWRPNYRDEALVDGKFSVKMYLKALSAAAGSYRLEGGRQVTDFDRFCYHMPFTRMAAKAHDHLLAEFDGSTTDPVRRRQIAAAMTWNRVLGNTYSASLYIALASLLENDEADLAGAAVGLFGYGSGCTGIFFGGRVRPGYRDHLRGDVHSRMLAGRRRLDMATYERFYAARGLPTDGAEHRLPTHATGRFRLAGIRGHQRLYEAVSGADQQRWLPAASRRSRPDTVKSTMTPSGTSTVHGEAAAAS